MSLYDGFSSSNGCYQSTFCWKFDNSHGFLFISIEVVISGTMVYCDFKWHELYPGTDKFDHNSLSIENMFEIINDTWKRWEMLKLLLRGRCCSNVKSNFQTSYVERYNKYFFGIILVWIPHL